MLSRTTGAISLRIIYGYEIQEEEDLFRGAGREGDVPSSLFR